MKHLLAVTGVCALSFGCAQTPASSPPPNAAGAKAFLDTVSDTNFRLGNQASQAGWVQQTYITDDTGAMWRSKYDMPPDDFTRELDRLWEQVRPLYVLSLIHI